MSKKLKLIIDTSQQQISESIDFSATDNKKEKIDWFGVTKERVRKLAKEKRYKDTVLA